MAEHYTEEWRPVVGYNGAYEVSSLGRVRRVLGPWCVNKHGRCLRARHNKGYTAVGLSHKHTKRQVFVHHLVLEAFVGPRPDGYQCDHINCIRDDNRPANLRWVTPQENTRAMFERRGGYPCHQGVKNPGAKLNEEQVRYIRSMHQSGAHRWKTRVARELGVSQALVSRIVHGVAWTHLQESN